VTAIRSTARVEDLPTDLSLTPRERRVVARLLDWLRDELGSDLLAVWLFGSRARGEADLAELDPDRRSDVDLLVVVDSVDTTALRWKLRPRLEAIADEEAESPVWFSVAAYDAERLRERRQIDSFFIQEVDRDKVVLLGDRLDGAEWS
jgi:predicted nucleotidyltransferase